MPQFAESDGAIDAEMLAIARVRKTAGFLKRLEPVEELEEDNKSSCTLANGARVVSLPGDPDTLRGYSAPKLIIKDDAAYVSDTMQAALDRMLAVFEFHLGTAQRRPNCRARDEERGSRWPKRKPSAESRWSPTTPFGRSAM